jgi:hypothetical protein
MVAKQKTVSSEERQTYYTILMPDYDGDTVLCDFKNNGNEYFFTTSLFYAKRFGTEEKALDFISKELNGSDSYKVIPIEVTVTFPEEYRRGNS